MQVQPQKFKPLSSIQLTAEENKLLSWIRSVTWEPKKDAREPIHTAKVPEFFGGIRLWQMQGTGGAGAAQGRLALFIKKLEYQGIISRQEMHPVVAQGTARYLSLKKSDLENLGVGRDEDED